MEFSYQYCDQGELIIIFIMDHWICHVVFTFTIDGFAYKFDMFLCEYFLSDWLVAYVILSFFFSWFKKKKNPHVNHNLVQGKEKGMPSTLYVCKKKK